MGLKYRPVELERGKRNPLKKRKIPVVRVGARETTAVRLLFGNRARYAGFLAWSKVARFDSKVDRVKGLLRKLGELRGWDVEAGRLPSNEDIQIQHWLVEKTFTKSREFRHGAKNRVFPEWSATVYKSKKETPPHIIKANEGLGEKAARHVAERGVANPLIVDIGFGTGYTSRSTALGLKRYGIGEAKMVGIEFTREMIKKFSPEEFKREVGEGIKVRIIPADAMEVNLSGRKERIDGVVSTLTLHHLTNPDKVRVLERVREKMKKGARIDIVDPDGFSDFNKTMLAKLDVEAIVAHFIRPAQMVKILQEAGFRDARIEYNEREHKYYHVSATA